MSTMSGSHTGQIQWHQDTAAVLWLREWWGTPLLLMLVTFLRWVILQELSVTKIFTLSSTLAQLRYLQQKGIPSIHKHTHTHTKHFAAYPLF
jgi:hypothetical protein